MEKIFTKWVAIKDLGTLTPPNLMSFRPGCSQIGPGGHISTFFGPIFDPKIRKMSKIGPEKTPEAYPNLKASFLSRSSPQNLLSGAQGAQGALPGPYSAPKGPKGPFPGPIPPPRGPRGPPPYSPLLGPWALGAAAGQPLGRLHWSPRSGGVAILGGCVGGEG